MVALWFLNPFYWGMASLVPEQPKLSDVEKKIFDRIELNCQCKIETPIGGGKLLEEFNKNKKLINSKEVYNIQGF